MLELEKVAIYRRLKEESNEHGRVKQAVRKESRRFGLLDSSKQTLTIDLLISRGTRRLAATVSRSGATVEISLMSDH